MPIRKPRKKAPSRTRRAKTRRRRTRPLPLRPERDGIATAAGRNRRGAETRTPRHPPARGTRRMRRRDSRLPCCHLWHAGPAGGSSGSPGEHRRPRTFRRSGAPPGLRRAGERSARGGRAWDRCAAEAAPAAWDRGVRAIPPPAVRECRLPRSSAVFLATSTASRGETHRGSRGSHGSAIRWSAPPVAHPRSAFPLRA